MILSILICTIPKRADKLARLRSVLDEQAQGKPVEIIVDDRPAKIDGGPSIGEKRQSLLERATGKYVCFFDDDDLPSPDYIEAILQAASHDPDAIGLKMRCFFKGGPFSAAHSIRYKWQENFDGHKYVRSPHHITPVRREIALQVGFKGMNHGEDHDYSKGLVGKLHTEVFIDRFLYDYLYEDQPAKTKYGA